MKSIKQLLLLPMLLISLSTFTIFGQVSEKCGTFSSENLAKIGMVCSRPTFYPRHLTEQVIQTENFRVHFVTDDPPLNLGTGSDVTTWAYAQKISNYAEHAWNYQCNILGWNTPPGDEACGGSYNKYDIYIKNDRSFGYAQPETQIPGTNKYSSFIVITNLIGLGNNPPRPLTDEELKVTVAHEFNHALQFSYNGSRTYTDGWFYENTATWIEEIQYPAINEWITFFLQDPTKDSPLNKPHLNIDATSSNYAYSGALFCHMLSRWFNNQLIRDIWQYASTSNNLFRL